MERRFVTFIIVSFAILAAWQFLSAALYPSKPKTPTAVTKTVTNSGGVGSETGTKVGGAGNSAPSPATTSTETNPTSSENPDAAQSSAASSINAPPKQIIVETPFWQAVFDNRGAVLKSLSVKYLPTKRAILGSDYGKLELVSTIGSEKVGQPFRLAVAQNDPLTKQINEAYFTVEPDVERLQLAAGEQKELVFKFRNDKGLVVEKRFRFYGDRYLVDLQATAKLQEQPLNSLLLIGPNFGDQSIKKIDTYINTPPQLIVKNNDTINFIAGSDLEHRSAPPDKERVFSGKVDWVAAADHYFAMVVVPPTALNNAKMRNDFYTENEAGSPVNKHLLSLEFPLLDNQRYQIFFGPKERGLMSQVTGQLNGRVDLEELINYGWFSILVKPLIPVLELLLKGIYKIIPNYGWGIIFLTLFVNIVFFPLKYRSSVAMKKAAKMQPKMKEIQEQIRNLKKDDPRVQQLQVEQMKLLREGNPLSGCLPLLAQLPLFWAIYIYLSISVDVRHQPFIAWVKDLAAPDHTWILPILMTISMMAATALTPTPTTDDPGQKMQRVMMAYIMPVVFLVMFFASAPSGLVLYWMFNSLIGVLFQLLINKLTAEPTLATAK
jgi:YidC/Oxa1 family membrane protein insertase